MSDPATAVLLFAAATVVAAILTASARRYSLWRELLDHPGRRRSHALATPRGGGIGPVATILVGGALLALIYPAHASVLGACLCGLMAVAAIGWLDDHRPLPAWLRLLVQILAAVVAALALLGVPDSRMQTLWLVIAVGWIVGLTNAWNFMDGIDGLATTQTVLVTLCVFAGALLHGWLEPIWSGFAVIAAGASLGFLPFNFPRARIFLGDVGSGAFGFIVACLLLRAIVSGGMAWPLVLLPVSAFLIDAGLTLAMRMVQGRPWWRPHREHLYQWLVRSGISHANTTLAYAAWTLASCLATLALADLGALRSAGIAVAALLSAALLWSWARKRLWSNAKTSNSRAGLR